MNIAIFDPVQAIQQTSGDNAQPSRRNSRATLDFAAGFDVSAIFEGFLPNDYPGGGITVVVVWAKRGSGVGNAKFDVAFERVEAGVTDLNTDNFAAPQSVVASAPADNVPQYTTIAFTDGQIDGLIAGEAFRIQVTRNGEDVSDTLDDDAQILRVFLRSTAGAASGSKYARWFNPFENLNAEPRNDQNSFVAMSLGLNDPQIYTGGAIRTYNGGDIRVRILWNAVNSVGTVTWEAAFGKVEQGDSTATTFAAAQSSGAVAAANSVRITEILFTNAQADGLAEGDFYQIRLEVVQEDVSGSPRLFGFSVEEV